jgi:hypothetical protein
VLIANSVAVIFSSALLGIGSTSDETTSNMPRVQVFGEVLGFVLLAAS